MKEVYEFRLFEKQAQRFFGSDIGTKLGTSVRIVRVTRQDPLFRRIGEIDHELGSAFFSSWDVTREYSHEELEAAALLHVRVMAVFEPTGEECGTVYDDTSACNKCGAGRGQVSELRLNTSKIPPSKDMAKTIAEELVVSDRFAQLICSAGFTGVEFAPVVHAGKTRAEFPIWHQLLITSKPVPIAAPTRAGVDPFDDGHDDQFRCPLGHVIGLSLTSELSLGGSWDGSDFVFTQQMTGVRKGLLVPAPSLLISRRVAELIQEKNVSGCRVEVAHMH